MKKYLRDRYSLSVARIALDAGLTCPNRDGTLSSEGCLFCDAKGSGTGAAARGLSLAEQVRLGLARTGRRADRFILYFQSFTNTYAPPDKLEEMWDLCLADDNIVGLAVGTRPDCLPDQVLDLLAEYDRSKEVWLELGLQSASDRTLRRINRGHGVEDFARAARRAMDRGLRVLAHVIIGLPGEGEAEVVSTARFIAGLGLFGVKVHSLYVSRGTGLERLLASGLYECLSREEFVRRTVSFLENIPPATVVHRLTGDPDPQTLVAPAWCLEKNTTLEMIRKRLAELNTWQGRNLGAPRNFTSP
ncbi:MAG: TIGR01212 family radical SAM protein [Thermodesulfobacteriota bacterium]